MPFSRQLKKYVVYSNTDHLAQISIFTAAEVERVRVEKFSISTSLLIRAALRKGFDCAYFPEKVVKISNSKTAHFFKDTTLPCNDAVSARLACNKYFLRRLLQKEDIPTPRTVTLRHPAGWQKILTGSLRFPLVVKPINASHANGASINITTPKELKVAVDRAFNYVRKYKQGNRVLVEEYFAGLDLRLLVVGDKVVSVIQRDPAYVIGDGHHTIRQLIHMFNKRWHSPVKYELPLCPIPLDAEVTRYLSRSNLSLNAVLPRDEKAYVRWNANISTGGRPINVTDEVHPSIKKLAVRVTKLSNLEVCGVDILCKNYTSGDISSDNVSVLEANESPGFDIHYFTINGPGQDICSDILNHIFKTTDHVEDVSAADIESLLKFIQIDYAASKTKHEIGKSEPTK